MVHHAAPGLRFNTRSSLRRHLLTNAPKGAFIPLFASAMGTVKESQEILKSEVAEPSEEQGVGVRLLQDHSPCLETGDLIQHHRKIGLCKLTGRRGCLFSA